MSQELPRIGRPWSVLTPQQAAAAWAEYQEKPFNISERARQLGVKTHTLGYHVRGGAAACILRCHWRAAARAALQSFNAGDKAKAAAWFREAADRLEKSK